jgi:hypothetical protein
MKGRMEFLPVRRDRGMAALTFNRISRLNDP